MALSQADHHEQDSTSSQARGHTVLGLESSCDDTAAAIVHRDQCGMIKILAEVMVNQNSAHKPYGGVVPEIAARAHTERMDQLVVEVLKTANLKVDELDGIAATAGPGLIGGVMAALMTAKGLVLGSGKPLIAVNHLEGHALSPRLTEEIDFPYLLLLVSGGHTQLVLVQDIGQMTRLGSTLDDAAGEAFDKTAKIIGLGFPGGPLVEKFALKAQNPNRFDLPRMLTRDKSCNFSFSGLKTAAKRAWDQLPDKTDLDRADLSAAVQKAIAQHLSERTKRAIAISRSRLKSNRILVIAGGVAANSVVRAALKQVAQASDFECIAPPIRYCTDNAAMIALAGAERLARGMSDTLTAPARARWPLDMQAAVLDPASGSGRKGPKA